MYWRNLIDEIGATSEENRLNTAGFMERHIKIQGSCIYPQFSYYWYHNFTSKDRDVEGIFERFTSGGGGGGHNVEKGQLRERRRHEFCMGVRGIFPRKILKSGDSKIAI